MITSAHIRNVLPKMKLYAIAPLLLGMQAPTEEVHVVLEAAESWNVRLLSLDHCR